MSYVKSHASSPHRFPHTCIFPCIIKSFLKQNIFVLALAKVSWTDSDKILDHPPILFIWTDSDNNVDYPPIFIFGQTPIKFGGQPSEINILDDPPNLIHSKSMSCTHTQFFSRCPRAHAMLMPLHKNLMLHA